jgi:peptidyl-prolyl cis-trans isomerase C
LAGSLLPLLLVACAGREGPPIEGAESAATEAPFSSGVPFDPESLPPVVARVGGEHVTREQLLERAESIGAQLAQAGETLQGQDLYREVLRQIVGGRLLFEASKDAGYLPSTAEVAAEIEEIEARFGSAGALDAQLGARGGSRAGLAEDIRHNLAVQRYVENEIASGAQVSEEEIRAFYQENGERLARPEQVRVRHILLGASEGSGEERQRARERADQLRSQLEAGGDFAMLAQQHSDDPGSASQGGELPWIARGQTVPPFEEAAFALQPRALSAVVESAFGFHLIELLERRAAAVPPLEEVRAAIRQQLVGQRIRTLLDQRVDDLMRQAGAEILI